MRFRGARFTVQCFVVVSLALGTSIPALGASSPGSATTGRRGGSVVVAHASELGTWNGDLAFNSLAFQILPMVTEPLVLPSPPEEAVVPGLAKSWDFDPAANTLTFQLQDGAAFSNGDPVTSTDVAFSAGVWKAGEVNGVNFAAIDRVETPDPQTAVFHLTFPDSYLINQLSTGIAGVYPNNFGGQSQEEYFERPIGAGPFRIRSEDVGKEIVLSRNPHYFGDDEPLLNRMVFKVIPDTNQRILQFESGEIDILALVPNELATQLPEDSIQVYDASLLDALSFNFLVPPMDDVNFRKAVALAINRPAIVKGLYGGQARVAGTALIPFLENSPEMQSRWSQLNRKEARALLEQSSYDGETVTLTTSTEFGALGDAVADQLEDVGINIKVEKVDESTLFDVAFSDDHGLLLRRSISISGSVGDYLTAFAPFNFLFTNAPQEFMIEQVDAFRVGQTVEERQVPVDALQDWMFDNLPWTPIDHPKYIFAVSDRVKGFEPNGLGVYPTQTLSVR